MADPVEDLKNRVLGQAVQEVARRKLEDATLSADDKKRVEAQRAGARRTRNIKLVLGATAVVVVGIGIMTLLARLWFYAMALAVVAGVGGAGYLAIRPRLMELRAERARKQLAARQRASEAERQQQAEQGKQQEARRLEEQLAALKKKS